jgi:hypothetical protein
MVNRMEDEEEIEDSGALVPGEPDYLRNWVILTIGVTVAFILGFFVIPWLWK